MIPAPQPDHFSFAIIAAQRIGRHARLDASTMKWFRDLSGEFSFSNRDSRGADARSLDKSHVGIMRPAGRLANASGRVHGIEPRIGIRLQGAGEATQVTLRVLALAIR